MRTVFVIIGIMLVTVFYSVTVMIHMVVFRDKQVFFLYARSWSRVLLRLSGISVHLLGTHHIVHGKRYVYVANHASLFDIPVILATIPDNIRIMYKRELTHIPVFGWCLRMSPFICVNRARNREAADVVGNVINSMKSGSSVLVFPEGTRSLDGAVGRFRRGAIYIATKSHTPIIPLSLNGTSRILPAKTKTIKGGRVTIVVGESIVVDGNIDRKEELELNDLLREIIITNVNSHHDE